MCLTFTKAAAAEMANRLFERLSKWIALDDEALARGAGEARLAQADAALLERARQLFTRALETPGGLKIQTIHAFCERVLQLFPVEAGIVPHFTMLDDRESLDLLQAARNTVLAAAQGPMARRNSARRCCDVANRVSADDFDKLLTQLLAKRANLRGAVRGGERPGTGREPAAASTCRSTRASRARALSAGLTCDVAALSRTCAIRTRWRQRKRRRSAAAEIRAACAAGRTSRSSRCSPFCSPSKCEPRKCGRQQVDAASAMAGSRTSSRPDQARLADALGQMGDLECLSATLSRAAARQRHRRAASRRRSAARGAYDFDDLIIKTGELLQREARCRLGALQARRRHRAPAGRRGAGHEPDAVADRPFTDGGVLRRRGPPWPQAPHALRGGRPEAVDLFLPGRRPQCLRARAGGGEGPGEGVRARSSARWISASPSAPRREILQAVDGVFAPDSPARTGLDGETPRDWHHEPNRRDAKGTVEIWPLVEPEEKEEPRPLAGAGRPRAGAIAAPPAGDEAGAAPSRAGSAAAARRARARRWRPGDILILVKQPQQLLRCDDPRAVERAGAGGRRRPPEARREHRRARPRWRWRNSPSCRRTTTRWPAS